MPGHPTQTFPDCWYIDPNPVANPPSLGIREISPSLSTNFTGNLFETIIVLLISMN
jgi:hypothetical protein